MEADDLEEKVAHDGVVEAIETLNKIFDAKITSVDSNLNTVVQAMKSSKENVDYN